MSRMASARVLRHSEHSRWNMQQSVKETLLETMLTARQVAGFLHVSVCTIRRWSDKGMLRFYRLGPRGDRRYRREDVILFLDESSCASRANEVQPELTMR